MSIYEARRLHAMCRDVTNEARSLSDLAIPRHVEKKECLPLATAAYYILSGGSCGLWIAFIASRMPGMLVPQTPRRSTGQQPLSGCSER